ncbi:hypothetical protein SDC9_171531 [bioreactor metagenome]|uniref:Uncharacterized protein n=1 Tax=bioreactor metagenome TaxID=1076179 RepID=A0A645GB47_9ZZZZ
MTGIGQVEAVFVDDHRLQLDPLLPRFLGNVEPQLLAQFAGHGREIESLGFAAELDAVNGTCHENPPRMCRDVAQCHRVAAG